MIKLYEDSDKTYIYPHSSEISHLKIISHQLETVQEPNGNIVFAKKLTPPEAICAIYEMLISKAENEAQLKVFNEWWNGKQLWKYDIETDEFIRNDGFEQYSDTDWCAANSLILIAYSAGIS